jgi:predicted RNase H-like nuclease (RuvC/YqgF family)
MNIDEEHAFIDRIHAKEARLLEIIQEGIDDATEELRKEIQGLEKEIARLQNELNKALMVDKLRESGELLEKNQIIERLKNQLHKEMLANKYAPWVEDEAEAAAREFIEALCRL